MRMNEREKKDLGAKKEDEEELMLPKNMAAVASSTSSSRQWSSPSFKNPRIVRVSRSFGGKDRHSKVCTVRGLRDRRIRLSVPTAIQLYDLQDRLGLSQPSKVIDWLLDATKHEIDKLPPLPMIPSITNNLLQFHHQYPSLLLQPNHEELPTPNYSHNVSDHHHHQLLMSSPNDMYKERERWNIIGGDNEHNFFPVNNSSSQLQFSAVPTNYPYSNYYFPAAPNLSLSQVGGGYALNRMDDDQEHPLSQASSSHQIYSTPPPPPYVGNDHFRQMNHLQYVQDHGHLINSPMKSYSLNAGSLSLPLHSNETGEQEQDMKDDNRSNS